ncbi:MAG: hypothetical protein LW710_02620 [Burkholderiales bacterium]|uniref:hypothetical protein n=1 Tax=Limnobacter sp. TaxID=2003368 RepID=UPI0039BCE27B|nr:hypothetical protein [Burkholderiales bacterium]
MNTKPIDEAKNADLRGSFPALQRAAKRARELAAQTGTKLVVSRGGVIEYIVPTLDHAGQQVQESLKPYANKP